MNEQLQISFDTPGGLTAQETSILRLVQRGRQNAISMPTLAAAVGISTRELQSIIQHLINDHNIMICSSCGKSHGYYYPDSVEDYERGRNQLIHRIRSLAKRLRAIDKSAYEKIFHQEVLNYE